MIQLAVAMTLALLPTGGMATAATATSTTVQATAIHIGNYPAYVRTVVDFTGKTVGGNPEMLAPDAHPFDGRARLQYVIGPGVRATAAPRSGYGLSVSIVKNPRGLAIDLRSAPRHFKYLSYAWGTGYRMVIKLWKSAPPTRAAEIRRGAGGCLALRSVSVDGQGILKAAGSERGIFEHQFRAVVRASDGRVAAQRTVHAGNGRWSVTLLVSSQRRQAGTFESAAISPADGALVCLIQQRVTLAYTGPAPLRLVYRAHADVDGDGKPDLITLHRISPGHGLINARLASGPLLSINTSSIAVSLPALSAVGNVDGRPGEELFVDVEHISTNEFIGVYTYWKGQLRHAVTLSGYSAHPGLWAGMTCSAHASRHFISVHQFVRQPGRYWTRQDTAYVWNGPSLKLYAKHPARRIPGLPSPSLVGLHCGHSPHN